MKASELKPGQFFEFDIDKRKTRCRRTATGYEYIVEIPEEDFTDTPVTPLAVTGWDDEPQSAINLCPACDCGDGYRQLDWREQIISGDEWLAGDEWKQVTFTIGDSYRPVDSTGPDSHYVTHAIHRRKVVPSPAPLQLREGAWYRRRDGKIVGPAARTAFWNEYRSQFSKWTINTPTGYGPISFERYGDDGKVSFHESALDLTEEVLMSIHLKDGAVVEFDSRKFVLLVQMQGKTDCKSFDNKWDAEKFGVDMLIRHDKRVFLSDECWMCCGVDCGSPGEVLEEWKSQLEPGECFRVIEVIHNAKMQDAEIAEVPPQSIDDPSETWTVQGYERRKLAKEFLENTEAPEPIRAEVPPPVEPVQFKAGDWLYCCVGFGDFEQGHVYQHAGNTIPTSWLAPNFRLATPAEIEAHMLANPQARSKSMQRRIDADGWIAWDKGYCPPGLHDELIEVRTTASGNLGERPAKVTYWGNSKLRPEDNITHYRLVPSPQPVIDLVEVVTR